MKKGNAGGLAIGLLVLLILVFSAPAGAQQKSEDAFKCPPMLRIATPTTQSASFAATNGWAPLLRNKTGANIRVVPEDSELRRYMRFALAKEFELASISSAEAAASIEGIGSAFLYWTRPDVDQEMVYRVSKWFHEAFDTYKEVHATAPRMALTHYRKFLDHSPLPVADGAVRYLREIGAWTQADDQWNTETVTLMDRWVAARNTAMDEAETKKVRVHCENQAFVDIFNKHTKNIPVFKTRIQ